MNLGVDESNHGRYPEIFVGCFSARPEDILEGRYPKKHKISKKRTKHPLPYRHILFHKPTSLIIAPRNFVVIATCEFARFAQSRFPLKQIYVDGSLGDERREILERLVYAIDKTIKIHDRPNLDRRTRLVNEADRRAYQLYRYYISPTKQLKSLKTRYANKLITPKLEDYVTYFSYTSRA